MPAAADQGTGATIAFTTSSFSAFLSKIGGFEITRGAMDVTYLGSTTHLRSQPADLSDPGEFEIEGQYDVDLQPPYSGAIETITITLPLLTGSVAATIAGTGFCTSFTTPDLAHNQVMMFKAKFKWSGATGPTFTDKS